MYQNLKNPEVSRDNAFNLIRLICCLIVLYEHCVGLAGLTLPSFGLSSYAVHTFFILSGFWVTKSILRSNSVKEYTIKRVTRIFPSYWFVVLFWAIVLVFFSNLSATEYFTSGDFWKYIFWNGITLNFVHPNLPGVFVGQPLNGAVNGALWTIKIEVAFYILLPFILLILNKTAKKSVGGGGSKCIVVLAMFYVLSVIVAGTLRFIVSKYDLSSSLTNQIPSLICYFFAGMILLFCYEWFIRHFIFVLPAIVILALHYAGVHTDIIVFKVLAEVAEYLEPIALSVLVLFLALHLKLFSVIGRNKDYSYLIYLWHFPVIRCLSESKMYDLHPILGILGTIVFSFFLSYLFNKLELYLKVKKVS